MGKVTISMAIFNSYVNRYQRVKGLPTWTAQCRSMEESPTMWTTSAEMRGFAFQEITINLYIFIIHTACVHIWLVVSTPLNNISQLG